MSIHYLLAGAIIEWYKIPVSHPSHNIWNPLLKNQIVKKKIPNRKKTTSRKIQIDRWTPAVIYCAYRTKVSGIWAFWMIFCSYWSQGEFFLWLHWGPRCHPSPPRGKEKARRKKYRKIFFLVKQNISFTRWEWQGRRERKNRREEIFALGYLEFFVK